MNAPEQLSRTFAIHSLGCKVNQYEGQAVRERLCARGWRQVPFREHAALYIVNTCTVTRKADEKSMKAVRRAAGTHPGAKVVVTGCAASVPGSLLRPGRNRKTVNGRSGLRRGPRSGRRPSSYKD